MSETVGLPVLVRPLRWGEPSMGEGNFVLPTGTVTLVLGDVEGSTRAWEADAKAMAGELATFNALIDEQVGRHDGLRPVEQGEGDSFVAAFARARDAVACALAIQRDRADSPLRLRIGIHAGDVLRRDEGNYAGPVINRAARIRNAAHGGQTVLSQATAELTADNLPEGAWLVDLGVHRLKDLSRPERIFQLCHPDLAAEFPPLRSLDARSHNLPVQRTSFVGRHAEMAELKRLMADEALVTLVGSGGCGKTRLAVQATAEVIDDYPDGVWLADLAAVSDPGAVASQVTAIFALNQGPGMTATDAVAAFLSQKRALLILDNCEHVLEAAAAFADRLASACPDLRLLATSRQPLDLPGEITWRVPSLAVPGHHRLDDAGPADIAGLAACEAVQLFVDRASRSRPSFSLTQANSAAVADICRRLDGIPLAIELAAARIRVFTPAQIASGLDQRFELLTGAPRTALPRQQTLEASVDWSHDLLTEVEQAVFRRLSVFAGGFDYDAAVEVCAAPPIAAHQVLDQLSLLVDKSLVIVDDQGEQARYRLLETVRDYAATRLAHTNDDTATRSAHRDHYLALAEAAEAHLEGPGQIEWIARVAGDYPNLRAALAWSRDHEEIEALGRIAAALPMFWVAHGPVDEGAAWLDFALAVTDESHVALRAKLHCASGWLAMNNFDVGKLLATCQDGLRLASSLGDLVLQSRMLVGLGFASVLSGEPSAALDNAVGLARQIDDRFALAAALASLGIARMMGDPAGAQPLLEESIRVADEYGDRHFANISFGNLALVLFFTGELAAAKAVVDQFVQRTEVSHDVTTSSMARFYQSAVLGELGDQDGALVAAEKVETLGREFGLHLFDAYAPMLRSRVALAKGEVEAALQFAREAVALSDVPLTRGWTLSALLEAQLSAGMIQDIRGHLRELIALGDAMRYFAPTALALKARLCRLEGDLLGAESAAHDALAVAESISAKSRIVDSLEVIAGIVAQRQCPEEAARLFGAAEAIRHTTGYTRCVSERDADLQSLRAALGDDAFQATFEEGNALSLDEGVAYARRGRGERKRPDTGWASLTPAEIRVAELVKDGLSNADIGRRLLCSARTVQAHLTHIYAKLGISSRAELAAQTTQHQA